MMSWVEIEKKYKVIIFFVLLILLISLIFLINEDNRKSFESFFVSLSNGEKKLELVTSINSPRVSNMKIYEDKIFLFDDDKISSFDMEGRLASENQFNFEDPVLHFGDNYSYIGDRATGEVYKLDSKGQTKENRDFEKPLFNIREEDKNTIYHAKSEGEENIYLYDKNDVLIGDHSFKDKNIIHYTLNPSASKYAISLLDLQGNKIKSELLFYGENNKLLNSFEIDDELLIYSKLLKGDSIVALTDSSLYYIKDGEKVWSKPFSIIKDLYIDKDIYILYSNYLEVINLEGETIDKISFTNDYEKITPFNKAILVYGNSGLVLLSEGVEKLSYSGKIDLLSTGKSNIVILNNDKLEIYKMALK